MNLKTYNAENSGRMYRTDAAIAYNKLGSWTLSAELSRVMGLEPGDKVVLLQDEDEPLDWYVTKHETGFPVRQTSSTAVQALTFNAALVRREFMAAWLQEKDEAAPDSARMLVATEPVKHGKQLLYPILTASLTTRGRGRKQEA